jgi:hypothetical protein
MADTEGSHSSAGELAMLMAVAGRHRVAPSYRFDAGRHTPGRVLARGWLSHLVFRFAGRVPEDAPERVLRHTTRHRHTNVPTCRESVGRSGWAVHHPPPETS